MGSYSEFKLFQHVIQINRFKWAIRLWIGYLANMAACNYCTSAPIYFFMVTQTYFQSQMQLKCSHWICILTIELCCICILLHNCNDLFHLICSMDEGEHLSPGGEGSGFLECLVCKIISDVQYCDLLNEDREIVWFQLLSNTCIQVQPSSQMSGELIGVFWQIWATDILQSITANGL